MRGLGPRERLRRSVPKRPRRDHAAPGLQLLHVLRVAPVINILDSLQRAAVSGVPTRMACSALALSSHGSECCFACSACSVCNPPTTACVAARSSASLRQALCTRLGLTKAAHRVAAAQRVDQSRWRRLRGHCAYIDACVVVSVPTAQQHVSSCRTHLQPQQHPWPVSHARRLRARTTYGKTHGALPPHWQGVQLAATLWGGTGVLLCVWRSGRAQYAWRGACDGTTACTPSSSGSVAASWCILAGGRGVSSSACRLFAPRPRASQPSWAHNGGWRV